jgi:hypothetical protein
MIKRQGVYLRLVLMMTQAGSPRKWEIRGDRNMIFFLGITPSSHRLILPMLGLRIGAWLIITPWLICHGGGRIKTELGQEAGVVLRDQNRGKCVVERENKRLRTEVRMSCFFWAELQ